MLINSQIKKERRPLSVKKAKELKEKLLDQKIKNQAEKLRIERRRDAERRRPELLFNTKKVDYREKVMVKIDRTTFIYADRGKEKQAKEEFLKKYKRPLEKVKN